MDFDPLNSGDYHRFESTGVDSGGGKPSQGSTLGFYIKFITILSMIGLIGAILTQIGRS